MVEWLEERLAVVRKVEGSSAARAKRLENSDCLYEIRKIAECLWLSLPGDYKVTDEALLAETT